MRLIEQVLLLNPAFNIYLPENVVMFPDGYPFKPRVFKHGRYFIAEIDADIYWSHKRSVRKYQILWKTWLEAMACVEFYYLQGKSNPV